jgi:hypothetical protein
MTQSDFDNLSKTHKTIANSWSSETMSTVKVLGNDLGTPVAMRYTSQETDGEFRFVAFSNPVIDN